MTNLKLEKLKALGRSGKIGEMLDILFDGIENYWLIHGAHALNNEQRTLLAVASFFGEVTNGGLMQFLESNYGSLANEVVTSLENIDEDEYALIVQKMLGQIFASEIPTDRDQRWAHVEQYTNRNGDEAWEQLEEPFWDRYFKDGVNNKAIDAKLCELFMNHCETMIRNL